MATSMYVPCPLCLEPGAVEVALCRDMTPDDFDGIRCAHLGCNLTTADREKCVEFAVFEASEMRDFLRYGR